MWGFGYYIWIFFTTKQNDSTWWHSPTLPWRCNPLSQPFLILYPERFGWVRVVPPHPKFSPPGIHAPPTIIKIILKIWNNPYWLFFLPIYIPLLAKRMIKIGWTVIDYRHCSLTKGRKAELSHFPRRQGSLGMNLETKPPADFLGSWSLDQSFKTENVQCSLQALPDRRALSKGSPFMVQRR